MNTFEPVKMAGSIAYDRSMPSQIDWSTDKESLNSGD
jgi:hypothetical protein